ncbi:RidA family protein [Natrarchaeobius chitinivorans]|uniref:RidA family protein n=1 Tax=Natrarchaeobius chitinivorans TaxID=1679083 RepID=A0A3N6MGY1_NATCH|nr:RidA family protein [Natrarchaeobius chitinivorans]RQG94841.1 RidA family protein [Natrarchaeobius chitinivorans]
MTRVIHNEDVPVAPEDFSQGWEVGDLVVTAGQVPMKNDGSVLIDEPIDVQTRQCLDNLVGILEESGLDADDVVKTTVYLDDIDDFDAMNEVYQEYFTGDMPARSVVEVATVLKGAAVKIEAIAAKE